MQRCRGAEMQRCRDAGAGTGTGTGDEGGEGDAEVQEVQRCSVGANVQVQGAKVQVLMCR